VLHPPIPIPPIGIDVPIPPPIPPPIGIDDPIPLPIGIEVPDPIPPIGIEVPIPEFIGTGAPAETNGPVATMAGWLVAGKGLGFTETTGGTPGALRAVFPVPLALNLAALSLFFWAFASFPFLSYSTARASSF